MLSEKRLLVHIFGTLVGVFLLTSFSVFAFLVLFHRVHHCRRSDWRAVTLSSLLCSANSFNRNFPRRNDGNAATFAFIGSPEIVTAYALAGTLDFNPLTDPVSTEDGTKIRLEPPEGLELPPKGFADSESGYLPPATDGGSVELRVKDGSERLEVLEPFAPWDGIDYLGLTILLKAKVSQ